MSLLDVLLDATEVPYEEQQYRKAVCHTCPRKKASMCMECKCVVNLKVLFQVEDCPLGKWNKDGINNK